MKFINSNVAWIKLEDKLNKEWKLRDAKKEKNKKTNIIKFRKKKKLPVIVQN